MKTVLMGCLLSFLAILLIPSADAPAQQAQEQPQAQVLLIAQPETASAQSEQPSAAPAADAGDAASMAAADETCASDDAQMQLDCGGEVISIGVQEYLTSVVLCEMPVSFEPEALKAQAVAARTFLWKQAQSGKHDAASVCADSACCQAWMSEQALREKFGSEFDDAWEKAAQAVLQTADEVLCYDGALIDATYFSCSGGSTEAAVAVWGTDVPYLQSVASPGEQDAARYESEVRITLEEFRAAVTGENPAAKLDGAPESWLGEVTYTEGGGVDTAMIGGTAFSGVALRRLFGLNSTKFTLSLEDSAVTFRVLGFGHRVGMSQYGADNLAANGFSYRVILQYYYQNTRIKKLSRTASGQYELSD